MSRFSTALVTGGSGFIGSALTRRLVDDGWNVICLTRARRGTRINLPNAVELRPLSSTSPNDIRQALAGIEPEVVFHLAAHGVQGGGPGQALAHVQGNVNYSVALIDALAGRGVRRFLYMGSCFEYGPCGDGHRWRETDPCAPFSVYGATKLAGSEIGRTAAAELGMDWVALRLFATYGPGEAQHRLVSAVIRALQSGDTLNLTSGIQVRDWLYVEDAVEAILRAARAPGLVAGATYNLCTGVGTSVRDVGETVARLLRQSAGLLRWGARPERPNEPRWIVGDPSRFSAASGWSACWPVSRGLEQTLAAFEANSGDQAA